MTSLRIGRILVAIFAAVVAVAVVADVFNRQDVVGVDFHTYAAAAFVGVHDGWSDIYDQGLVDLAQRHLAPWLWTQPFLSPPPVAWLVALVMVLPYNLAYMVWAGASMLALAAAFAWSTHYRGIALPIAVAAALTPWWVVHAAHVGQVAPFVAASLLVAWRLARENRDVAAGLVLTVVMLKPNTAILAPVALLMAGRTRAFTVWFSATAILAIASAMVVGPHGIASYMTDLANVPPAELRGASQLTLYGTFGLAGVLATAVRALIVVAALVAAYRYRNNPGLALAVGAVGSLMVATYLHGSDYCVLGAAGWIIWSERRDPEWRALLAGVWVLATPFIAFTTLSPPLHQWMICELAIMVALLLDAWRREPAPTSLGLPPLTWPAAFGRRAPA